MAWWKTLLGGEEARAGPSLHRAPTPPLSDADWGIQESGLAWRRRVLGGTERFCCEKSYATLGFIFKRQLISTRLYGMESISLPS